MPKMKAYASFAEWKKDQSAKNKRLIGALQKVVEGVAPQWTKSVKWGQGCWLEGNNPKIYLHAEEDHMQFGFYAGSSLTDPNSLLKGSGKYVRHVKVRTAKDVDVRLLSDLVRQVVG